MEHNDTESFVPKVYTIAPEAIGTKWSFEEFVHLHGEYGGVVAGDSKRGIMEFGIFEDASNNHLVTCLSNVVKKYSREEFEKNKPNLEVVVLESRMYCVCSKWEDVDLDNQSNDTWSLLSFAKAHGKMQVGEFTDKETGKTFKACVFTKPSDGTRTFVTFSSSLGELPPQEIVAMKDDLIVEQYEDGNYSLCKKGTNNLEDVILDEDDNEPSCPDKQEENPFTEEVNRIVQNAGDDKTSKKLIEEPKETQLGRNKDINWKNLKEIKSKVVDPYSPITTFTNNGNKSASPSKRATNHLRIEPKDTFSQYLAVFIDILVVLGIGLLVYFNDMIRLDQDRELFLGVCCLLAVLAWGYPYFDTSIKIDNDGCLEQGCIHPIIGVFGVLFLPLFIHYWLYKGIKICIVKLKKHLKHRQ